MDLGKIPLAEGLSYDIPVDEDSTHQKHTLGISMSYFGRCVVLLPCVSHFFSVCVCRLLSVLFQLSRQL